MKFKCTFLGELTIIIKFKANNMNLFRLFFFIYLVSVVILCQHQLLYFVIQIYLLIILAIQR